jgi:type I restriction enzyme S subunit
MTEEQARVPKLRFPGFADAWEQRKLGELVDVRSGQDYKHLSVGDIPVYGTGGYMLGVDRALSYSEDAIGIGRKGTIDKPYVLHAPFWTVDTLFYAVPRDGNDLGFLYSTFERVDWRGKDESTGVPSLSKKTINDVTVASPSAVEQRQIGAFFASLDDLIALHQRKLSHLGLLKKGLLQKMFPKPGEAYPEIRFPGFADAWEQRKLGELVDVRSGQDYKHLSVGDIPVYGTGGYMLGVDRALSYSEDAIGIGRKGTIDKPYVLHAPFWTVDTLFYAVPRDGNDLGFLYSTFERVDWRGKDESTGVPSLSKKTINDVTVASPSAVEQRQIGAFFASLDDLIALHQRKLTHLQQQKKALLQQMFV